MNQERQIWAFAVQHYNKLHEKWLTINDRIFVRNYVQVGVPREIAEGKARSEADRQVSGWSGAFPHDAYRALPIYL